MFKLLERLYSCFIYLLNPPPPTKISNDSRVVKRDLEHIVKIILKTFYLSLREGQIGLVGATNFGLGHSKILALGHPV